MSFIVCCEVGLGNFTTDRYGSEREARTAAGKLWCCWVLYSSNSNGTELTELGSGGVGFSHPNIRKYADSKLKSKARDADARVQAAAAAEARAAKMAASQPKPKPTGPVYTSNGGKPDISNPVAWD